MELRDNHMLSLSKALAERAAWDFMEKNKDKINFDLATILPCLVSDTSARISKLRVDNFYAERYTA